MDIQSLTSFFMWCTIINFGFLIWATLFLMAAPDFVYRIQSKWINISRENFDVVFYAFLGVFKIFAIVFSLVPWLALLIMQ